MKKICSMLILCLLLVLFSGCNLVKQDTSNEVSTTESKEVTAFRIVKKFTLDKDKLLPGLKKIVERGKLRVASINVDMDRFCYKNEDGSLSGKEVQLAQDIADCLGVSLELNKESDTYNNLIDLLLNDKADLIIAMYSLTTTRAASIKMTKPYLTSRFGIMVNKQDLVKHKIEKNPINYMLNNEVEIVTLKESYDAQLVKEVFPKAKIIEMDNDKDMYDAVKNGDVFGCFSDELTFICDYNEDKELSLNTKVFAFSDIRGIYGIGVSPDNDDLLNFVNAYITASKNITVKDYERYLKEKSDKK